MIKPLYIPRGVAYLFCQGHMSGNTVNEDTQHRPDFLNNEMRNEIINNWMNKCSPISLTKRKSYGIADVMFMSYFGRI